MLPNISFIIPILHFAYETVNFLHQDDDRNDDENMFVVLNFLNVIPLIIEILNYAFDLTKDTSQENDACKLIRYLLEYR